MWWILQYGPLPWPLPWQLGDLWPLSWQLGDFWQATFPFIMHIIVVVGFHVAVPLLTLLLYVFFLELVTWLVFL